MKKKILIGCGVLLAVPVVAIAVLGYLIFHRVEGQYFDSNGARIYYTVEGQGEPVILIHGLAANADLNWRRVGVTSRLARHFQVIAFDCRGHGLSERPEDPTKYGLEMVEDITRLMDRLGIAKAHMAGYSMGGFILLKFMTAHPERVRSAALCASGWKDPDDPSEIPSPYRKPPQTAANAAPPAQEPVHAASSESEPAPKPTPIVMADKPKKKDSTLWPPVKYVRDWVGDKINNRTALKALKKSFRDWIVTKAEIEANQVPAICFIGTNDGLLPLAEDMHKYMANLEYVKIAGASHFTTPLYREFQTKLEDFFLRHQEKK